MFEEIISQGGTPSEIMPFGLKHLKKLLEKCIKLKGEYVGR